MAFQYRTGPSVDLPALLARRYPQGIGSQQSGRYTRPAYYHAQPSVSDLQTTLAAKKREDRMKAQLIMMQMMNMRKQRESAEEQQQWERGQAESATTTEEDRWKIEQASRYLQLAFQMDEAGRPQDAGWYRSQARELGGGPTPPSTLTSVAGGVESGPVSNVYAEFEEKHPGMKIPHGTRKDFTALAFQRYMQNLWTSEDIVEGFLAEGGDPSQVDSFKGMSPERARVEAGKLLTAKGEIEEHGAAIPQDEAGMKDIARDIIVKTLWPYQKRGPLAYNEAVVAQNDLPIDNDAIKYMRSARKAVRQLKEWDKITGGKYHDMLQRGIDDHISKPLIAFALVSKRSHATGAAWLKSLGRGLDNRWAVDEMADILRAEVREAGFDVQEEMRHMEWPEPRPRPRPQLRRLDEMGDAGFAHRVRPFEGTP